jgi:hypothetical protein
VSSRIPQVAVAARRIGHALRSLAGAILGFTAATVLHAMSPVFTAIAPAGAQRGSEVEVTLRGDRLADAQEIFVYGPGITVEKLGDATEKQVKATLKIAADCRLGEHALRVRTASGISALRLFYVGPFPAVDEKEPNNAVTKPQAIAMNSTVHGTIANEDTDYFTVTAKKDERVSVEVEGARLGRTMFDPYVAIQDASGRVLASSDDTPLLGHDGYASTIAPADGKYVIQVRDMAYSGAGHFYRLHVGTFPRPAAVFPLGGQAGETLEARFIGDPAGEFQQTVKLPAEPIGKFGVIAEHDGLAPSPNWVRVVDFPNASAVSPATSQAKAPLLDAPAPVAFNGLLATKGEAAFFRVKVKKAQNLNFEIFGRRLGSPIDSVLTVYDAKGKSLGTNDDAAGNPDSALRLRVAEDGEYTIKVADQLNRGGPTYTYRVEISEVRPTLTLSIPDTARYDNETRKSIVVPRGNRFAVLLNLNRDTCNDDLNVLFDGLPPGIKAIADIVPGSLSAVPVVFEADADAPFAGSLLTPAARPVDAAKSAVSRFRHAVEWVRIQNDTVYVRSEVGQIAAAVAEPVPFKIRIAEPKVPLVQSGDLTLSILAEREDGFDEPITVKMLWNPPGVSSLPDMVIPKGEKTIGYKLNSTNKAEVRKWKIAVVASATIKGATPYVASQLAELEIALPYLSGKMDLAKVERGQSTKFVCVLSQKIPFEGTATAKLVGLPANATAEAVEITKDSKQAVFEVVTTDKTPVGITKNIFCNVTITQNGEPISHIVAPGSVLRVDAARPKPTVASVSMRTEETK